MSCGSGVSSARARKVTMTAPSQATGRKSRASRPLTQRQATPSSTDGADRCRAGSGRRSRDGSAPKSTVVTSSSSSGWPV